MAGMKNMVRERMETSISLSSMKKTNAFIRRNSYSSGRNNQLRIAPSLLLHSIVVKVSDFGARGPGFESHLW